MKRTNFLAALLLSLVLLPLLAGSAHAGWTDDLIGYWKLDEASGNALDSHGSNNLTDNNSVGAASGKVSGCRDYTASSNHFHSIADNAGLSTGNIDFTVALWVQVETTGADRYIVTKYNVTGNQREYAVRYRSATNRFAFDVSSDGTAGNVTTVEANNLGAPSTGVWYFVACWHDAANDQIGIQVNNGTADTAAHSTGAFDGTSNFRFGARQGSTTDDHDGLIDEVGFWKRILTTDEKMFLYNSGNGRTYPFSQLLKIMLQSMSDGVIPGGQCFQPLENGMIR